MTTTKQNMLDLLGDERDRLVDQMHGVDLAVSASCSTAVLSALLLPGLGTMIALTARAACAAANTDTLQRRVVEVEALVTDIEDLADRVLLVDENNARAMDAMERDVLRIVNAVRNVDILGEAAERAVAAARGFISSAGGVLAAASNIAAAVAVVAVVVGGLIYFRK